MNSQDLDNFKDKISGLETAPPGLDVDVSQRWNRLDAMLNQRRKKKAVLWVSMAASILIFITLFTLRARPELTEKSLPSASVGSKPQLDTLASMRADSLPLMKKQIAYADDEVSWGDVAPEFGVSIFGERYSESLHSPISSSHSRYDVAQVGTRNVQGVTIQKKGKLKSKKSKAPKATVTREQKLQNRIARRTLRKHPELVKHNEENPSVEEYAPLIENEYRSTKQEPLSTFSIDVDAASYSLVRRHLMEQSVMPVKDAVRIEEMVNYFEYDYKTPQGEVPFEVNTELSDCPWNKNHQLLAIALQGKKIANEQIPASNLVFLLDVSGSMGEANKLPLVKNAIGKLVGELRGKDKVSIVVYAGAAGMVLPPTAGSNKAAIMAALNQLQAGGSTAGGEGIELAYKIAKDNFLPNGNNRVILCTDGDFNVGVNSESGLEELITRKREEGVFLSVLGFGMGNYKDSKMEILADKGNGNYAYIDNEKEGDRVFVKEFGATMFTIAKDVKFQIEFNPAVVKGYRLVGYENRMLRNEDFANDKIDAGELGAGHRVTALYEIIPASSAENIPGTEPLRYQQEKSKKPNSESNAEELMFVKLRYKESNGSVSKLVTIPVAHHSVELANSNENFRWASAVACFGMLLRDSKFASGADFDLVLDLARGAVGTDFNGYRKEFIEMVEKAKVIGLNAKGK